MAAKALRKILGSACLGVAVAFGGVAVSGFAMGQTALNAYTVPVIDGPRVAVLVGNTYFGQLGKMDSVRNDVVDMKKLLKDLQFEVHDYHDLSRADFYKLIKTIMPKHIKAAKGGFFLFYYTGHGLSLGGKGRIMPIDASVNHIGEAYATTIKVEEILEPIASEVNPFGPDGKGLLGLAIFDACRNSPEVAVLSTEMMSPVDLGVPVVSAPAGLIVAASTQPGNVASPGDGARNSRYTGQFMNFFGQPGVSLIDALARTTDAVKTISSKSPIKQTPWVQAGDISLGLVALRAAPPPPPPAEPPQPDESVLACNKIVGSADTTHFVDYLQKFPQGPCAGYAKAQLSMLLNLLPSSPQPPTVPSAPGPAVSSAATAALAQVGKLPPVMLQHALIALGHYSGKADGDLGPNTRRAVEAFQQSREQSATGTLTPEQTVVLIRAAAETGQAQSQNTMGLMFATGVGVEKDAAEAVKWFRRAADQGDAQGKTNLALMLLDGAGVVKDTARARSLLTEAAAVGYDKAQKELEKLR